MNQTRQREQHWFSPKIRDRVFHEHVFKSSVAPTIDRWQQCLAVGSLEQPAMHRTQRQHPSFVEPQLASSPTTIRFHTFYHHYNTAPLVLVHHLAKQTALCAPTSEKFQNFHQEEDTNRSR